MNAKNKRVKQEATNDLRSPNADACHDEGF